MSQLKAFGVYLLNQENIRKNANTGVEALTIDQIAELHATAFEPIVEAPKKKKAEPTLSVDATGGITQA